MELLLNFLASWLVEECAHSYLLPDEVKIKGNAHNFQMVQQNVYNAYYVTIYRKQIGKLNKSSVANLNK